jgi:hypothetical protein
VEEALIFLLGAAHFVDANFALSAAVVGIEHQHALKVRMGLVRLSGTAEHEPLVVQRVLAQGLALERAVEAFPDVRIGGRSCTVVLVDQPAELGFACGCCRSELDGAVCGTQRGLVVTAARQGFGLLPERFGAASHGARIDRWHACTGRALSRALSRALWWRR